MRGNKTIIITAIGLAILLYSATTLVGISNAQVTGIVARYVEGPLPITEPNSPIWGKATEVDMELGPQLTAQPWIHPEPSVRSVRVRAVNNGTWIAFLMEWEDETKDDVMLVDTFRDAAAVMLALQPGAGQCMGTPSAKVLIAHWKADWQRDVDEGFADLEQLYPNFWSDWYPMALGEPPYTIKQLTNTSAARLFIAGLAAGNILSNPSRTLSVETLVAHGWGTLTTTDKQLFIGRGVHDGKVWRVVLARPLITGVADPPWASGQKTEVVFAVWDGSNGEIGAKKGVSLPTTLEVEMPVGEVGAVKTVTVTTTVAGVPAPGIGVIPTELLIVLILVAIGFVLFLVGVILPQRRAAKQRGRER